MTTTPTIIHPVPVAAGATHFRLRKGGKTYPDLMSVGENGVSTIYHPISDFDKDTITARWGFSQGIDYFVQFSKEPTPGRRQPLGSWRAFGIQGETAEIDAATGTEVVRALPHREEGPSGGSGGVNATLQMLMALDSISQTRAQAAIETHRLDIEASRESERNANQHVLTIMTTFLDKASKPPAVGNTTDPALLTLLSQMNDRMKRLEEEFEEPEEEEPEELDAARYAELVRDVRKNGPGELWEYAKEKGIMALIEALPILKAKLPDMMRMVQPLIEQKFREIMAAASGQPAPAPAAPQNGTLLQPAPDGAFYPGMPNIS
jgi:hypothetical protein